MKFVCISDTHNQHKLLTIPDADMIIHSGDSTSTGTITEITEFCEWYGKLPHKYKILIAGNHDWGFQKKYKKCKQICEDNGIIYLQDSSIVIEGIKIHGSPQTPEYFGWAFNCWRTKREEELNYEYHGGYKWIGRYWKLIPDDTDILITHGPPNGILDGLERTYENVGCVELMKKVLEIKPKYHIFGHIHGQSGEVQLFGTHFINASSLGEDYKPNNKKLKVYEIAVDKEIEVV